MIRYQDTPAATPRAKPANKPRKQESPETAGKQAKPAKAKAGKGLPSRSAPAPHKKDAPNAATNAAVATNGDATNKTANRRTREAFNAYQRDYMRQRRADRQALLALSSETKAARPSSKA